MNMDGPRQLTEEEKRRRRRRSLALGWTLALLAVLFFITTLVHMGGNVLNRPL